MRMSAKSVIILWISYFGKFPRKFREITLQQKSFQEMTTIIHKKFLEIFQEVPGNTKEISCNLILENINLGIFGRVQSKQ